MPRGGKRQGAPGVAYGNRTDLLVNRAPSTGLQTPAVGAAAAIRNPNPASAPVPSGVMPEDIPALDDQSARPGEAVTTGLTSGPGAGPEVLAMPPQQRGNTRIRAWLPFLEFQVRTNPNVAPEVVNLVRYLRGTA